jgi:hypothetical protein
MYILSKYAGELSSDAGRYYIIYFGTIGGLMSAKNKTTMTKAQIKKILGEEDVGCLCLSRNGEPYGVPVSYAFIKNRIVFHSSLKGRKLDFIRKNKRVCFVVSRHPDRAKPHHPEKGCKYRYESVVCSGKAVIIRDVQERFYWLSRFLKYFNVRIGKAPDANPITEEVAARVGCVVIKVDKFSGRKKL